MVEDSWQAGLGHTPKRRLGQAAEIKHMTSDNPKSAPDIAARLIANGYQPIPIPHGQKGPNTPNWQNRTFSPTDFDADANIGVKHDRLGCVDVDVYDADLSAEIRDEFLRRFPRCLERVGQAPKTALVFRLPDDPYTITNTTKRKKKGVEAQVEMRTKTGQMVAYGKHPDTQKAYRWTRGELWQTPLASLPMPADWEIQEFRDWAESKIRDWAEEGAQPPSQQAAAAIQPPTGHKGPIIATGGRSAFFTFSGPTEAEARELLGHLDFDMPHDDWVRVLMALHDAGDHMLPLAIEWSSQGSKFRPGEIERKWRGFTRGSGVGWATIPALAEARGAKLDEIGKKHRAQVSPQPPGQDKLVVRTAGFSFVPVGKLHYRAPEFVIDGLLETETLGLIFGDPGCGKSFLAVDIAASVATGTPFHGRVTKQGPVFFIAGEGHNGLARRFTAWAEAHRVPLNTAPLFKSERAAQFLDAASAGAVTDAVANLSDQHGSPALIIVDTLARNFGAGDENNTRDMSEFVVAIDDLRARFPGCAVLIVHHSGHADKQRARGAMALKGALDAEYRVEKDGNLIKLICTKMKDAEPPADAFFRLGTVNLAEAQSAVLEATSAPERQRKLTPTQELAVTTYRSAASDHGRWDGGAFKGVHVDDWRKAFYAKHTGDNADAKRKAFQRARRELVEIGELHANDDLYLTRDPAEQLAVFLERDKRDMPGHLAKCPDAEAGNSGTSGTCA